mgnify:CR=1 FL=1
MSKASDLARLMTSGSTAIHGEAGVTASGSTGLTTNLQQGLAKQWISLNGDGTAAIIDSFNTTSITDNGTGEYSVTIANDMSNANYSLAGIAGDGTSSFNRGLSTGYGTAPTSTLYTLIGITSSSGSRTDCAYVSCQLNGDLA